jgi:hypothetical protein
MGNSEIFRIFECGEDGARQVAAFLHQDGGRQIARGGVDCIPKQHQLHERDHDNHGEGNAITPELDELLHQHGPGLAPEPLTWKAPCRLRWWKHMRH